MLSMGLARIAKRRGSDIQTFKKGPDYIDPLWLKAASGKPCCNIDPYLQTTEEMSRTFAQRKADIMLVEGTMGLHDGLCPEGTDSNASVAKMFGLPILLIVDCRGMHRTIAPLINGLMSFDDEITYSGVVLNRIRSSRHAQKIESAIQRYCELPLVGVVPEDKSLGIVEKELGLLPAPDHPTANSTINKVADLLERTCDIDGLLVSSPRSRSSQFPDNEAYLKCDGAWSGSNASNALNTTGSSLSLSVTSVEPQPCHSVKRTEEYRVGIARDEAFNFYYEDDLEEMRSRGIRLIPFSPIRDQVPTKLDGLLIGGGFPERHASALSSNHQCRRGLATLIEQGLPVRAECGGLMYLCKSIEADQVVWPLVGAIQGHVKMHRKPQGRGYMQLRPVGVSRVYSDKSRGFSESNGFGESNPVDDHNAFSENSDNPSKQLSPGYNSLAAHEFHHSSIQFEQKYNFAYRVERGFGIDGCHDGLIVNNTIASYAHFRHTQQSPWIDWFIESMDKVREINHQAVSHV